MYDWRRAQAPLGARLFQLRILHCMTQQEVARRVGMSRISYSRIERGDRRIHRSELEALARLYRIPVATLATNMEYA